VAKASDIEILYDKGPLLVVNKPAGLPSTGRDLDDPECAQARVMAHEGKMVWAAHQLDKGTSGALLFTRKKALIEEIHRALKAPAALKRYLAVATGEIEETNLVIDAPLAFDAEARRSRVEAGGQEATTIVRVLDKTVDASLVFADLKTGRTHQIRAHLAHLGHPLVGDARYGGATNLIARQALHACRLRIVVGDDRLDVKAPVPDDFEALLDALELFAPLTT